MVLSKAALKFVKELEEGFLKSPTRGQEKSINELSKVTIPSNFEITATYHYKNTFIIRNIRVISLIPYNIRKYIHIYNNIGGKFTK